MNDQVTLINEVLLDHWADLEIPHKDLLALKDKEFILKKPFIHADDCTAFSITVHLNTAADFMGDGGNQFLAN